MPRLTPEVINLSWEAAQASNRAFDALQEAEAGITKFQEIVNLAVEGVVVSNDASSFFEQKRNDAETNFNLLMNTAASITSLPNNPFALNSTEDTPTAEQFIIKGIDTELFEQLKALSADYRQHAFTLYAEKRIAVTQQIQDGELPESYQLPELNIFTERVVALASTYEVMVKKDWKPEVLFVPKDLSLEKWGGLIRGRELLGYGRKSGGARRSWTGYRPVVPTSFEADGRLWDVVIISGAERPVMLNVSKDGKHGSKAKQAVKELSELPNITDTSSAEAIIKQASPTEEHYFALQLAHLERGEKPVDAHTWTIGKENIQVGKVLKSLCFHLNLNSHQVRSELIQRGSFSVRNGIRPLGEMKT